MLPGRLYVEDMPAFVDSLQRLVALTGRREVRHVLGCHVAMTRMPGRDYPIGARYQPDEPPRAAACPRGRRGPLVQVRLASGASIEA